VKQGIDYLVPFIREPDLWPYSDLQGIVWDSALRVLLQSVRGYAKQSASYREALKCVPLATRQREIITPHNVAGVKDVCRLPSLSR
jgi:hypothetical protein